MESEQELARLARNEGGGKRMCGCTNACGTPLGDTPAGNKTKRPNENEHFFVFDSIPKNVGNPIQTRLRLKVTSRNDEATFRNGGKKACQPS